jgi:hypothetical protein
VRVSVCVLYYGRECVCVRTLVCERDGKMLVSVCVKERLQPRYMGLCKCVCVCVHVCA